METNNLRINREHKDRMFRWIFKNKRDLLELYNAVNGTSYTDPDRKELYLSDAFIRLDRHTPCLELRVVMLNINWGHNRELMEKCKKLGEYAQFIDQIRRNLATGLDREAAVSAAVESCIESGILKDLLIQHKAEVMDMLLTEYNEELDRKELFEQGRDEGILEAKQEDILEILAFRGDVSDDIRQLIVDQTDLDVLKAWHRKAIAVPSISDFTQSLNQN